MKLIGLIISLTLVFADSNTQTELDIHLYENDCENLIKEILENSNKYNCKITCPIDVVVSKNLEDIGKNKDINKFYNFEMFFDKFFISINGNRRWQF